MRTFSTSRTSGRGDFFILVIGLFIVILNELSNDLFVKAGDKGDDIILHKGKIIMRGGKGKGNIILDPGSHSSEESHHVPMLPMISNFNPYVFYPMQDHHQHHEQPHHMVMPRPIYVEDHSAMHQHHEPEQHHEHHEHQQHHQEYHHEEPQHHHEENHQQHYEPQHHHHHEMEHQQHYEPQHHHHEMPHHHEIEHHEPMHHYEHESHEGHDDHEHQHEGYEHHQHPMMSMHGSGPQPIYQQHQMATMQPTMYAQLSPEQQATLYHHQAQAMAAHHQQQLQLQQQQDVANQQQNELQQGQGSSEVASQVSAGNSNNSPSSNAALKPVSKVSALLQKSANNPLVQIIKPLFKRNKDQKESEKQKKP